MEDGVELLEQAVVVMTDRAARLAGQARTHTPSVEEPLLVVLVDEVALLTAYLPDRKLRDRAERALATLATQGRAPGVVLVAALQDPRKEVLGLRNLFPTKVGMRLDEKTQVDMVLGDGARDAGAACHKIPETLPGVAYVKLDGLREPVRVRASYLTDADIAAAGRHLPRTHLAPPWLQLAGWVGVGGADPRCGMTGLRGVRIPTWQRDAACAEVGGDWWFPELHAGHPTRRAAHLRRVPGAAGLPDLRPGRWGGVRHLGRHHRPRTRRACGSGSRAAGPNTSCWTPRCSKPRPAPNCGPASTTAPPPN